MIHQKVTHEEYFAQFVNDKLKRFIKNQFGIEKLKIHFSVNMFEPGYINLEEWDNLVGPTGYYISKSQLKEAGENNSISTYICILKQAARMVVADAQTIGQ